MKSEVTVALRLITHNIRYATKSPFQGEELWPIRRPLILNELRFNTAHSPEAFICLQEVLHEQLLDISSLLNNGTKEWQYIGVGRDDGVEAGEYSPIFYRPAVWTVVKYKTVWLSETPDRPSKGWDAASVRILTVGVFQHRLSRKRVIAMNTHLDDQGSKSRLEAAKIISREMESLSHQAGIADIPTFLAGDLNSEPHMEAYRYFQEKYPLADLQTLVEPQDRYGHRQTFTGFGFDKEPLKRIDFLFVRYARTGSDPWIVKNYAVLENCFDDNVYSSDHRAVVADLELK